MFGPYVDGFRVIAEQRMDECSTAVIMRPTGAMTTNPDGFEVPEWAAVDVDCPGRLAGARRGASGTRSATVGGVEVQLATREWHMPASKPAPLDGDLIEIIGGENTGLVLRVLEGDWQDQATARRVPVMAAQRPEEWA